VEEGMQQGDPLGSFGFSAGAQSLLAFCNEIAAGDRSIDIDVEDLCEEGIESLATSHQPTNLEMRDDDETQHTQPQTEKKGFCAMYIDDFSSSSDFDRSIYILKYLMKRGPPIGLKVNKKKTKIILGYRGSFEEAQTAQQQYIDLGFVRCGKCVDSSKRYDKVAKKANKRRKSSQIGIFGRYRV